VLPLVACLLELLIAAGAPVHAANVSPPPAVGNGPAANTFPGNLLSPGILGFLANSEPGQNIVISPLRQENIKEIFLPIFSQIINLSYLRPLFHLFP